MGQRDEGKRTQHWKDLIALCNKICISPRCGTNFISMLSAAWIIGSLADDSITIDLVGFQKAKWVIINKGSYWQTISRFNIVLL